VHIIVSKMGIVAMVLHTTSLAAQPFLQCSEVEASFSHLWNSEVDFSHARLHSFGFVFIGVPSAPFYPFIEPGLQTVLLLQAHDLVDKDPDHLVKTLPSLFVALLQ
jgi:hypothetical protein